MWLCDAKKNDSRKALLLYRKGHLFSNMFIVIWAISKCHAIEAPNLPDFSCIFKKRVNFILLLLFYIFGSNIIVRGFIY